MKTIKPWKYGQLQSWNLTEAEVKKLPLDPETLSGWRELHKDHGRVRKDTIIGEWAWWYCSCGQRKSFPKDAT
jgi:hypothetical protein